MATSGTTPDGRFTYLEAGAGGAPPLVCLHGIGGGAGLFAGLLDALGAERRALAWDMPGYGGSAPVAAGGIDGYARALSDFLTATRLDRPVLLGHSLGGMIVQAALALGLPLRGAILAQTSAAFGGRDPAWAEDFVRSRLAPLDRGEGMPALAARAVAAMVGGEIDPAGTALAVETMAGVPEAAYRASTLAMIGFDRREALAAIRVPTLLVAGTQDANAPAATMAKMAERIPGGRLVTFEGCGHLVMQERPDALAAAVRDLLAAVDTA